MPSDTVGIVSHAADDSTSGAPVRCSACGAPLGHDQRYCLACGERRGTLPAAPAALIGAMLEQGSPAPVAPASPPPAAGTPRSWIPSPRAAAAAVLGTLTFGMFIGSVTGPGLASTLSAPEQILVSLGSHRHTATTGNTGAVSSSSSSAASAPTTTITQTVTVPAAATPASPAPAAQPTTSSGGGSPSLGGNALPPVKHVFLVVLSDEGYSQTFGSTNPYFSSALPKQGGLVPDYYGVTAGELANGIALISGQGPTPQTASDCPQFSDLAPGGTGALEQVLGTGCVYPKQTATLAGELSGHGGWRAYVEGVNAGPKGQPTSCRHPTLGGADADTAPRPKDPYVTWRNPFVYFHSLIDGKACAANDVALAKLSTDLREVSTTPALSYIAPSSCDDGSAQPCRPGAAAGLGPAAAFLNTVLPEIERSPAYKADGLIAVTFDQAPQSGPQPDTNGCCTSQPFPNLPTSTSTSTTTSTTTTGTSSPSTTTGTSTTTTSSTASTGASTTSTTSTGTSTTTSATGVPAQPAGGGQVGIVLISRWVKPGSTDFVDSYNHFSLLATIEKMLGVPRLGYAGDVGLPLFGVANFNNYFG